MGQAIQEHGWLRFDVINCGRDASECADVPACRNVSYHPAMGADPSVSYPSIITLDYLVEYPSG